MAHMLMYQNPTSTKQHIMKNKPFIFYSILTVFMVIFLFSCQKFDTIEEPITEKEIALKDASFSPQFDWESTRKISLKISSEESKIINITSTDKSIRYYKGMHPGNSTTYSINISVPSFVENLNLNNQELILNSDDISINL